MKQGNGRLRRLMQTVFLSAMATLLMFWQVPYPGAPWLKLELSDVPALIGSFIMGPVAGLIIVGIKNVLFMLIRLSPESIIGLPMNIIASGVMVLLCGAIYQRNKRFTTAIIALTAGALLSVAVMIPANYLILPFFMKLALPHVPVPSKPELWSMVMAYTLPFNLMRSILTGTATFLLYKKVAGFIRHEIEIEPTGKAVESGQ